MKRIFAAATCFALLIISVRAEAVPIDPGNLRKEQVMKRTITIAMMLAAALFLGGLQTA